MFVIFAECNGIVFDNQTASLTRSNKMFDKAISSERVLAGDHQCDSAGLLFPRLRYYSYAASLSKK